MAVPVPARLDEITSRWLEQALAEGGLAGVDLDGLDVTPMGDGVGFLGDLARLRPRYLRPHPDAPASLVAKLPTADAGGRTVGSMLDVWAREARFYRELATEVPVPVPRCFYNGADPTRRAWCLLLADLGPDAADQARGATVAQAAAAVDAVARLHARWWDDGGLADLAWLPGLDGPAASMLGPVVEAALPAFRASYAHLVDPTAIGWLEQLAAGFGDWLGRRSTRAMTLVHADYRLDNLLYDGDRLTGVVDWQTALRGPGTLDVASLLCTSLTLEDRRRHEDELLDRYVGALDALGVHLDVDLGRAYREGMLWWMALYANNLSTIAPEGRGRVMFDRSIERLFGAAVDHDAGRELD